LKHTLQTAFIGLFILSLAIGTVSGCVAQTDSSENKGWLEFQWTEADSLFQRDKFWVGGDGAYSTDLGNDRILWLFGDSWIDPSGKASRQGATMVSNSLAIQHGADPSSARAQFYWKEVLPGKTEAFFPDSEGKRFWPGNGIRVGDHLLLFLMVVQGTDSGLGFEVTDWKAVLVTNPDDPPPDWNMKWLDTPKNQWRIVVGSGGILSKDGYIYSYGAQEPGPKHDIFLSRWSEKDIMLGQMNKLEWWTGKGWTSNDDQEAQPQPVLREAQTEVTVHFDPNLGGYREVQTVGFGAASLTSRTSPNLTGPWSESDTLFTPEQVNFPRIMIYQGKAHPHLEGADLILTYSTNSFDFNDHFSQDWLYFPRFVRINNR